MLKVLLLWVFSKFLLAYWNVVKSTVKKKSKNDSFIQIYVVCYNGTHYSRY